MLAKRQHFAQIAASPHLSQATIDHPTAQHLSLHMAPLSAGYLRSNGGQQASL